MNWLLRGVVLLVVLGSRIPALGSLTAALLERLRGRGRLLLAACDGVAAGLLVSAQPQQPAVFAMLGAAVLVLLVAWHEPPADTARDARAAAASKSWRKTGTHGAAWGDARAAITAGGCAVAAARLGGSPWPVALTLPAAALAGFLLARLSARRLDRLLRELERSRASVASRNQLLATLAHEVRTPLTIIQATEGVLLDESPGPLNERQRKFLESIHSNTQRLIHFAENMLATIKVDRGWQPDRSTAIDLRRIVRQVIEMMQPLLVQRSQQVRYTFPSMLSRPMADEAWIRQVLVNLLHNASKHTSEAGMIVVSVTQNEQWVVVTVSDNGAGLAGTARESIFQEFYQEQPHSGAGQDGAGLGLAIVRSVIERHGGKVYAGTSPGLGTMVSFTLPVEEGE